MSDEKIQPKFPVNLTIEEERLLKEMLANELQSRKPSVGGCFTALVSFPVLFFVLALGFSYHAHRISVIEKKLDITPKPFWEYIFP